MQHVSHSRRAFVLLELMLVLGIITFLAGMVLAVAEVLRAKSYVHDTELLIRRLDGVLDLYEFRFSGLPPEIAASTDPSNAATLDAANSKTARLLIQEDGEGPNIQYSGGNPYVVDVYGHPIRIICGGHNRPGVDIWSVGPDGVSQYNLSDPKDRGDDIVNWLEK